MFSPTRGLELVSECSWMSKGWCDTCMYVCIDDNMADALRVYVYVCVRGALPEASVAIHAAELTLALTPTLTLTLTQGRCRRRG